MKIKEIYSISDNFELSDNLDKKYYSILNKEKNELNVSDVYFMLRQSILPDLARERNIELLLNNPLAGEMYEGQLLEILIEDIKSYSEQRDEFLNFKNQFSEKVASIIWEDDFEKEEFEGIYRQFKEAIK